MYLLKKDDKNHTKDRTVHNLEKSIEHFFYFNAVTLTQIFHKILISWRVLGLVIFLSKEIYQTPIL